MLHQTSEFYKNSLIFRGVVTGYSQHLYSAFLFAPKFKYELINGEFNSGIDFFYSTQKEYNIGQSVELVVYKDDSSRMTLRSNNLYFSGSVLAIISFSLALFSFFFLNYIIFHFS